MKKTVVLILLFLHAGICFAYTGEEKEAIVNYILKNSPNSGINPKVLLFYYLDNEAQIDVPKILAQQKQDQITSLQKSIADATAQLNALQGKP